MSRAVFHRLAERELAEAVDYYEQQRRELGVEFLGAIQRSVDFLGRYPEAAPKIRGDLRAFVLLRFPYSLIYRPLSSAAIRILAVAHHSRLPLYWSRRS